MASPVTKGGGAVDSRDAMHLAIVAHPSMVAKITGHNFPSWLVSGDSVLFLASERAGPGDRRKPATENVFCPRIPYLPGD